MRASARRGSPDRDQQTRRTQASGPRHTHASGPRPAQAGGRRQAHASGRRPAQASGPRWLRPVMGTRRRRIAAYVVALVCAALAGVLAVQHDTTSLVPRARTYLAFDACLLTRARGLAGPQAAQAWTGLQRASLATHAKVEYLPVMGPQTAAAALPVLSSLIQRDCNVIIAVGTPQITAVDQDAAQHPGVKFATIGGPAASVAPGSGTPASAPNVTVLTTATAQIAPAVDQLVTAAVQATGSN
jgi:hypothetical protein